MLRCAHTGSALTWPSLPPTNALSSSRPGLPSAAKGQCIVLVTKLVVGAPLTGAGLGSCGVCKARRARCCAGVEQQTQKKQGSVPADVPLRKSPQCCRLCLQVHKRKPVQGGCKEEKKTCVYGYSCPTPNVDSRHQMHVLLIMS